MRTINVQNLNIRGAIEDYREFCGLKLVKNTALNILYSYVFLHLGPNLVYEKICPDEVSTMYANKIDYFFTSNAAKISQLIIIFSAWGLTYKFAKYSSKEFKKLQNCLYKEGLNLTKEDILKAKIRRVPFINNVSKKVNHFDAVSFEGNANKEIIQTQYKNKVIETLIGTSEEVDEVIKDQVVYTKRR